MKKLTEILLYSLIVVLLFTFETGCGYLCRAFMPDETQKVCTHTKSTNTQLVVINDENDSRFYPRMAAIGSDTQTVNEYAQQLYIQSIGETESNKSSEYDINKNEITQQYRNYLDNILCMTVHIFSGIECKNLVSAARIEKDSGLLYIQNHPVNISADKTKSLDLIIKLYDARVLYYRLSDPDSKEASAAEVSRMSKKLIENINSFLPFWSNYYFPYAGGDIVSDYDDFDYEKERKTFIDSMVKTLQTDHHGNELALWFEKLLTNLSDSRHLYDIGTIETKSEDRPYMQIVTTINENDVGVTVSFPFQLPDTNIDPTDQEYHVYSVGGEIMVVFETQTKNQAILYYDVEEGCFTGFSA